MVSTASSLMRRVAVRLGLPQPRLSFRPAHEAERLTLLELVEAVSDTTEDDAEVVATVMHMLRSGSVMLRGNFRGEPTRLFCD